MTPHAFKRLHRGGKPQTAREWVAKVLDNHWVESIIMLLVVGDLVCVAIEAGVDTHLLCVAGKVMPATASELGHGAAASEAGHRAGGLVAEPKAMPVGAGGFELNQLGAALEAAPQPPRAAVRGRLAATEAAAARAARVAALQAPVGGEGHEGHSGAEEPAGGEGHAAHHEAAEVLVCDSSRGHHARHLLHVCHVCSVTILCIFMVELLLKWWANPAEFLSGWCHKLDICVVSISLFIDTVIVPYIESQHEAEERRRSEYEAVELVTFLLMFSRLWRIVRIFHGFFEEYHHFQEESEKPREENAKLRRVLLRHGLDPDKELEGTEDKPGAGDVTPPSTSGRWPWKRTRAA